MCAHKVHLQHAKAWHAHARISTRAHKAGTRAQTYAKSMHVGWQERDKLRQDLEKLQQREIRRQMRPKDSPEKSDADREDGPGDRGKEAICAFRSGPVANDTVSPKKKEAEGVQEEGESAKSAGIHLSPSPSETQTILNQSSIAASGSSPWLPSPDAHAGCGTRRRTAASARLHVQPMHAPVALTLAGYWESLQRHGALSLKRKRRFVQSCSASKRRPLQNATAKRTTDTQAHLQQPPMLCARRQSRRLACKKLTRTLENRHLPDTLKHPSVLACLCVPGVQRVDANAFPCY